eukprot:jgi/Mesvir1/26047/Mv05019-RA.1
MEAAAKRARDIQQGPEDYEYKKERIKELRNKFSEVECGAGGNNCMLRSLAAGELENQGKPVTWEDLDEEGETLRNKLKAVLDDPVNEEMVKMAALAIEQSVDVYKDWMLHGRPVKVDGKEIRVPMQLSPQELDMIARLKNQPIVIFTGTVDEPRVNVHGEEFLGKKTPIFIEHRADQEADGSNADSGHFKWLRYGGRVTIKTKSKGAVREIDGENPQKVSQAPKKNNAGAGLSTLPSDIVGSVMNLEEEQVAKLKERPAPAMDAAPGAGATETDGDVSESVKELVRALNKATEHTIINVANKLERGIPEDPGEPYTLYPQFAVERLDRGWSHAFSEHEKEVLRTAKDRLQAAHKATEFVHVLANPGLGGIADKMTYEQLERAERLLDHFQDMKMSIPGTEEARKRIKEFKEKLKVPLWDGKDPVDVEDKETTETMMEEGFLDMKKMRGGRWGNLNHLRVDSAGLERLLSDNPLLHNKRIEHVRNWNRFDDLRKYMKETFPNTTTPLNPAKAARDRTILELVAKAQLPSKDGLIPSEARGIVDRGYADFSARDRSAPGYEEFAKGVLSEAEHIQGLRKRLRAPMRRHPPPGINGTRSGIGTGGTPPQPMASVTGPTPRQRAGWQQWAGLSNTPPAMNESDFGPITRAVDPSSLFVNATDGSGEWYERLSPDQLAAYQNATTFEPLFQSPLFDKNKALLKKIPEHLLPKLENLDEYNWDVDGDYEYYADPTFWDRLRNMTIDERFYGLRNADDSHGRTLSPFEKDALIDQVAEFQRWLDPLELERLSNRNFRASQRESWNEALARNAYVPTIPEPPPDSQFLKVLEWINNEVYKRVVEPTLEVVRKTPEQARADLYAEWKVDEPSLIAKYKDGSLTLKDLTDKGLAALVLAINAGGIPVPEAVMKDPKLSEAYLEALRFVGGVFTEGLRSGTLFH